MHLLDDRSTGTAAASGGGCWRFVADTVMGGVSTGTMSVEPVDGRPALRLRGQVSLANNGGFIQIALDLPARPASPWRAVELDVVGDGRRYGLHLRTTGMTRPWQSFRASFEAPPRWQTLTLPIEAFVPHRFDGPLDPLAVTRIGLLAIGAAGEADLALGRIAWD
jgi:Complex I intermediate-associated protein 30 (CIA30)